MLYLHNSLIYVSFCFWNWVKDSIQNRKTLWGKCIEPFFFGPLLKCIFDFKYFRYKPHPQFFPKQMRLKLSVLISFVLRSISAANAGKVFNMFCVSDSLQSTRFTSLLDICFLSLTISCAEITLFVLLSWNKDSFVLKALSSILFAASILQHILLTLWSCRSCMFRHFCVQTFLM